MGGVECALDRNQGWSRLCAQPPKLEIPYGAH